MQRKQSTVTVQQASQESPVLSHLFELAHASQRRFATVANLIPSNLKASIQAGAIDDTSWCLLVSNNTVAAKLRQLIPALEAHLRTQGWESKKIRIKVQEPRNHTRTSEF